MADDNKDKIAPYSDYLKEVLLTGIMGRQLPIITTDPNCLEQQARDKMPTDGFNYIKGGAGESATMDSNRLAFRRWNIVPKVLRPTTPRDLRVTLFGQTYKSPLLMAPIGIQSLYHEDKEIGTANACAALGVPFTLSTASSTGFEELSNASPTGPKWFQLYWPTDEEITASILNQVKSNGYEVLIVTLDTWTLAWRPLDLDNANVPFVLGVGDEVGFKDPVFRRKFAERSSGDTPETNKQGAAMYWTGEVFPGVSHSWDDLKTLRKFWDGPIVLKGVLSVHDSILAVQHGMDGIIVSNHGGRQIDGAVATLDVLPRIVDAVGDKITVLFDSGIRTGADIIKALALGAKGVFVGRPVVYGLGINGEAGAKAVLAGILADLDLSMGLAGALNIGDLKRSMLWRARNSDDFEPNL